MNRSGAPLISTGDHDMQDRLPIALRAEGHLMPVLVRGHFGSLREVIVVSKLSGSQKASGSDAEDFRSSNWRKVCFSSQPNLVSGWCSIEHADFQDDMALVPNPVTYALALSRRNSDAVPYAYGHIYGSATVYSVLYVRSVVGGEKYERVGVGKLFGDDATTAFHHAEKRQLILV
jgi:hypothetical protein